MVPSYPKLWLKDCPLPEAYPVAWADLGVLHEYSLLPRFQHRMKRIPGITAFPTARYPCLSRQVILSFDCCCFLLSFDWLIVVVFWLIDWLLLLLLKVWNASNGHLLNQLQPVEEAEVTGIIAVPIKSKILTVGWNRKIVMYYDDREVNSLYTPIRPPLESLCEFVFCALEQDVK